MLVKKRRPHDVEYQTAHRTKDSEHEAGGGVVGKVVALRLKGHNWLLIGELRRQLVGAGLQLGQFTAFFFERAHSATSSLRSKMRRMGERSGLSRRFGRLRGRGRGGFVGRSRRRWR